MHEMHFVCSFFSAARRTNQEAPPRLSGFWACRYGRRRGLRNSLRSDSPRPFSSVFLATSPPDKGGIGGLACILTPSPCGHSPYIPCRNTPQCCGTRQGRWLGVAYFSSFLDTRGMRIDVYNCRTAATVSNIIQSGSSLNMKYEEATKKREENVSMW